MVARFQFKTAEHHFRQIAHVIRDSDSPNFRITKLGASIEVDHLLDKIRQDHAVITIACPLQTKIDDTASDQTQHTLDEVRAAARCALEQVRDQEIPIMIMNLDKIVAQVERWRNQIPDVEIFYSVKTNPNPVLLKVLKLLGVNFDCASSFELDLIARELKNPVESIVYSHPCKLSSHLQHADKLGVSLTVADNEEELDKIKLYAPHAQVLIRLAVDDSSAASPMSSKFGAAMEQVPLLLKGALQRGVAVAGVSFHVGNGCRNASAFQAALARARVAMEAGLDAGHDMHILDIGGGFPILGADGDCRHGDASFEDMAREIRTALDDQFPGRAILGRAVRVIAEPGQFIAGGCCTLLTTIHSRAVSATPDGIPVFRHYINDGLYGSMLIARFEHVLVPHPLEARPAAVPPPPGHGAARAVIFGPTLDGGDAVCRCEGLPELQVGDRLLWLGMGAYSTSNTTHFNGFPPAQYVYYTSGRAGQGAARGPAVQLEAAGPGGVGRSRYGLR